MLKNLVIATICFWSLQAMSEVNYEVRVVNEQSRRVSIIALIEPHNNELCFQRSAQDTGLTHGWATFIHDLKVTDLEGSTIESSYRGEGCWAVSSSAPVRVSYTALLQHDRFPNKPGDDELAYAGDWGQFWTGRALFVEGKPSSTVQVSFSLPEDWEVTAPWRATRQSGMVFAPRDMDALLDSGLMLGLQESLSFQQGDASIRVGLAGDAAESQGDVFIPVLKKALTTFDKMHAGSPVGEFAVFLGQGRTLGGGVMGQTISMLLVDNMPDRAFPILSYIIIHEAFHLWNAELNYDVQSDMYWFSEGFAEYFSHFELYRQGLVDEVALKTMFSSRIEKYQKVAGTMSLTNAGALKLSNYDLVYSGGMMAAWALDQHLFKQSNGKQRLADVLPALYQRYAQADGPRLSPVALQNLIQQSTGINVGGIFEQYILGTEKIPTGRLLKDLDSML